MRKIISFFLVVCLSLCLAGCDALAGSSDLLSQGGDLLSQGEDLLSQGEDLLNQGANLLTLPTEAPTENPQIDTYLDIAQGYIDEGKLDMAISILEDALDKCGENEKLSGLLAEAKAKKEALTPTEPPKPVNPYAAYAGSWGTSGFSWYSGGMCLELSFTDKFVNVELNCVQSSPANRIATVKTQVSLSEIRDGKLLVTYDDDGWGNSGSCTLYLTNSSCITCDVREVYSSRTASWGMGAGNYSLYRLN